MKHKYCSFTSSYLNHNKSSNDIISKRFGLVQSNRDGAILFCTVWPILITFALMVI